MKQFFTKNKPLLGLLFRILGFLVGCTAITLQFVTNAIIGKGFMANHVLAYFTLQTNIFTTIIFAWLIIKSIVLSVKEKKLVLGHIYESFHLACTFYITITMSVYWLVLAPMLGVGGEPLQVANTVFLHTLTPLFAIFDCVFFFEHGKLKWTDTFKWLAYPALYVVSLIIIANVSDIPYYKFPVGDNVIPLMYPYPFIDPQVVGISGMVGVIIGLFVLCILLGWLYIFIDNLLAKHLNKNKDTQEEN